MKKTKNKKAQKPVEEKSNLNSNSSTISGRTRRENHSYIGDFQTSFGGNFF